MREFLQGPSFTGCSRGSVGAGFIGAIVTKRQAVAIEFKPNTRDEGKIADMERSIREQYAVLDLSFGAVSVF